MVALPPPNKALRQSSMTLARSAMKPARSTSVSFSFPVAVRPLTGRSSAAGARRANRPSYCACTGCLTRSHYRSLPCVSHWISGIARPRMTTASGSATPTWRPGQVGTPKPMNGSNVVRLDEPTIPMSNAHGCHGHLPRGTSTTRFGSWPKCPPTDIHLASSLLWKSAWPFFEAMTGRNALRSSIRSSSSRVTRRHGNG